MNSKLQNSAQNAPKVAIFRLKIEKNSGEGALPPLQTPPSVALAYKYREWWKLVVCDVERCKRHFFTASQLYGVGQKKRTVFSSSDRTDIAQRIFNCDKVHDTILLRIEYTEQFDDHFSASSYTWVINLLSAAEHEKLHYTEIERNSFHRYYSTYTVLYSLQSSVTATAVIAVAAVTRQSQYRAWYSI